MIVLATNGPGDIAHLLVHGGTAVYMGVTSYLLFKPRLSIFDSFGD